VLALGRLNGTSRETGMDVVSSVSIALHLRDGLVRRIAVNLSESDARRDLGAD
jgi:hypothetical protein